MDVYLFERTVEIAVEKERRLSEKTIKQIVNTVSKDPAVNEGLKVLDYNVRGPILDDDKLIYHIGIFFGE